MKRVHTLVLLATLGLAATAVQAAQPDEGLTGCAAKRSAIENQLKIARDHGNDAQVAGLEEALRGVENCNDASLRKEREQKVLDARHEVAQREKDLKKAKLDPTNLELAKGHPKLGKAYDNWRALQSKVDLVDHAQRRLRCEKMFQSAEGEGTYTPGEFDSATTHALAQFEKKHAIMGWGHFTRDNIEALARSQEESAHRRLLRVALSYSAMFC